MLAFQFNIQLFMLTQEEIESKREGENLPSILIDDWKN